MGAGGRLVGRGGCDRAYVEELPTGRFELISCRRLFLDAGFSRSALLRCRPLRRTARRGEPASNREGRLLPQSDGPRELRVGARTPRRRRVPDSFDADVGHPLHPRASRACNREGPSGGDLQPADSCQCRNSGGVEQVNRGVKDVRASDLLTWVGRSARIRCVPCRIANASGSGGCGPKPVRVFRAPEPVNVFETA